MIKLATIIRYLRLTLSKYEGNIDTLSNGMLQGWVKKKGEVEPLKIDCRVNGVFLVTSYLAEVWRPDVKDAGYGRGRYGFEISIPSNALAGAKTLDVEISRSGTRQRIFRKRFPNTPGSLVAAPMAETDISATPRDPFNYNLLTGKNGGVDSERVYVTCFEKVGATKVEGYCLNSAQRSDVFEIVLRVDGAFLCNCRNDVRRIDLLGAGVGSDHGGFEAFVPITSLEPGTHTLEAVLPDGTAYSEEFFVPHRMHRKAVRPNVSVKNTTVIVPVFNAVDDLAICIERLRAFTPPSTHILFIDDASTDPRVASVLDASKDIPCSKVLTNNENLGFTRTVNRGIQESGRRDVVLLNSDARVTPGWVEGMIQAANSDPRISTVTAMSDRAGAFSAPQHGKENSLPPSIGEIEFAQAFRRRSLRLYPAVPTGNGFCMLVKRACIEEIGTFDADAFPRGYGEENDFCMRASRAGWLHVVDDTTYVFHERSKSFGEEKTDLMAAGRAVVDARYPEYKSAIQVFTKSPTMILARHQAWRALADCAQPASTLPRILFVISTTTGGTPQTNQDLMRALSDGFHCWVLQCDSVKLELSRVESGQPVLQKSHMLSEAVLPALHDSLEYQSVVTDWLSEIGFTVVHIRHIGWHSIHLPRIAHQSGAAVVFSFHDYYSLCPTVNLIDDTGQFCGGNCHQITGACEIALWRGAKSPKLNRNWVRDWRSMFERALLHCDAFVTTSESTRNRLMEHLPSVPDDRFATIPHGRDFSAFEDLRAPIVSGETVRILLPGNIGIAKGLDIIFDLLNHDVDGKLEFHVLGRISKTNRLPHARLINHGTYQRDLFAEKVAEIRPHLGGVFSIWDETYCHTLTELWSVGLPTLVFDFPTVATRVRQSGGGWVLEHKSIPRLYDEILRLASDGAEIEAKANSISNWAAEEGCARSTRVMAGDYIDVYRQACQRRNGKLDKPPETFKITPRVATVCPGNPNLHNAYASTFIRVWAWTENALDREVTYVRMSPRTLIANLRAGTVDSVIVQRNAIPADLVPEFITLCDRMRIPFFLDLDDELLDVPEEKDPDGQYRSYAPSLKDLMSCAYEVWVSMDTLAEKFGSISERIKVLPNRLSKKHWGRVQSRPGQDEMVRALYMGTTTHGEDLAMIMPALKKVAAAEPRFRLTIIGITNEQNLPDWIERWEVPEAYRDYDRFVPTLEALSGRFQFALAPLANHYFNRFKSPLKILDYGALALPVLASNQPIYQQFADVRGVELVDNSTSAWARAILAQLSAGGAEGLDLQRYIYDNHMLPANMADFDQSILEAIASMRQ